jgi:hypothetical protein
MSPTLTSDSEFLAGYMATTYNLQQTYCSGPVGDAVSSLKALIEVFESQLTKKNAKEDIAWLHDELAVNYGRLAKVYSEHKERGNSRLSMSKALENWRQSSGRLKAKPRELREMVRNRDRKICN